jgi:hypothetical protein
MRRHVGRRDVLRVVVVTGAVVPFGALSAQGADAAADATGEGATFIAGKVTSASGDRLVVRTPTETVSVVAGADARMYSGSDGVVSSTAGFYIGDRVGVEGQRNASGLNATRIGSIFTPIEARVSKVSTDGSVAYTSAGSVLLAAGRLPDESSARRWARAAGVSAGTVVRGLVWTHPSSGQKYLLVRG